MAEQLPLPLPVRPALGRADFVVTQANAAALGLLERARWPGGRLALTGPPASGKTHLAHVWAKLRDAVVIPAADLARYDIATLASAGRVAVEDAGDVAGRQGAEAALFHLYNRLTSVQGQLLVTGRTAPTTWPIALPDLRTRLSSMTVARLDPPDDALLAALLDKQLKDRGLSLTPPVFRYLVPRMTRSAAFAQALADEIDRLSLARSRAVTRDIAKDALDRLGASSSCHDSEQEGPA